MSRRYPRPSGDKRCGFGRSRRRQPTRGRTRTKEHAMPAKLNGKTIAFLAADGVEQVELTQPWEAVRAAGATPELISLEEGEVQAFDHLDKGDRFRVDRTAANAGP